MKELTVIQQQEILGKPLTVYGDFENPLFLAKEVAEWIEHSQVVRMLQNIDDDEKVMNIVHTPGGNQEAWFLTEDGVYEVLMQSRKPIAKQFKKEVKTVLKSIRKHGYYSVRDDETKAKLMRAHAMELNAQTRTFNSLMKFIDNKHLSPIAAEVFGLKALESTFGVNVNPYLPETEKTYNATEVGNMLGISAIRVGKIANTYELKTAEYGVFKLDKSRYSSKEVENFYYNQKGIEKIRQIYEEMNGKEEKAAK
ncbi:MAG: hypothetical protein HFE57_05585 [Firmicutes bacterium]|jgi:prophage antirepressor-like protein|nr:hypothetical protein [Bacillota bacterium]